MFSNPRLRTLGSAAAAFLAYGAWAYYANSQHGSPIAWRSALVQGSYSFVLTLSTTLLMERLYERFRLLSWHRTTTVLVVCCGLFATAYSINWLAGTPEVMMTIMPGFILGSAFTVAYVRALAAVS